MQQSMRFEYERSSKLLNISAKQLFSNRADACMLEVPPEAAEGATRAAVEQPHHTGVRL